MSLITLILSITINLYFIVIAPIIHPAAASQQWIVDGDMLNIADSGDTLFAVSPHALAPSLVFHADTPYVAWAEINSKGVSVVYVKHRKGNEWTEVGGPLNLSLNSSAYFPAIASSGDKLYAIWTEENDNKVSQVYIKEWNGGEWKQIGESLNMDPKYSASVPVISSNKSFLYAAWTELSPDNVSHLYVKQWDGSSWQLIADKINNDDSRHAVAPSLAAGRSGVYLTWSEYDKDGVAQLYASQWNGASWESKGDALNVDKGGHALSPSISVSGATPYAAWIEYNHDAVSRIYVKRLDDRKIWRRLGESIYLDMTSHASSPSLTISDSVPYIAWIESSEAGISNIIVKHWDGNKWVRDGEFVNNIPYGSVSVSAPSIAVKNKTIYLAFSETDESAILRLYVKRLADVKKSAVLHGKRPVTDVQGASRKFFTSIPKDSVSPADLPPPLAFKSLQRTPLGEIDWMSGIRDGVFKPFDSTDPEAKPALPPFSLDIVMPVKKEFGIPQVIFPHSSHTMWLDCRNCHPVIFAPKRGVNPITMHGILEGKYCAKCHGKVAFQLYDCFRCHSK